MAERFTAVELLDMLDSCDISGSDESDFEDDRMFSYLGTLSETVVAPSEYEGSTSSSTSDEVDDVAMLDDSLDSLSDGASLSCTTSKYALLLPT